MLFSLVLLGLGLLPASALAQDIQIVRRGAKGKQYGMIGLEGGYWLGSGDIRDGAETRTAESQAPVYGPVWIGIHHAITNRVHFGLRLGAGAVAFSNDQLIRLPEDADNGAHLGLLLSSEVIGRYVAKSGFTAGLGMNLVRVGLPDASGAAVRLHPRLGYMHFFPKYEGFWIYEVGYQVPIVNGLVPEQDKVAEPPVDSTWHMLSISVGVGL